MTSVLLVDDRDDSLFALETILKSPELELVKARSGEEALLRVLDHDFAVILLDVRMPGMDGYETAELVRQRERSRLTPIIFMTAAPDGGAQTFKGYQHGAVDFLYKPIVPEVLKAKVGVFVSLFEKEELLRRQTQDLMRANQDLERFAYVASHDLKEPLRKITGYTEMVALRYDAALDEEGRGYMALITDAAKRMSQLISDLLEYSRAGRLSVARVELEDVLKKVIEDLEIPIKESRASVSHDPLPAVTGDEVQLAQVFQNLIANGLKFRGEEAPRIHVGSVEEGESWRFFVSDNGIGIEPEYREKIFAMFERLHGRQRYPGTGIGLAICKKVVEAHGGSIRVESTPGEGSTFLFTLPKGGRPS